MQSTLNLLGEAEKQKNLSEWARELGLSTRALYTARDRGHLSPAVAGAMAEKLGKNVEGWVFIAAVESEKDSACKERMMKRARQITSLYRCNRRSGAQRPRPSTQ